MGVMIGWTIAARFRLLFRDRPWQAYPYASMSCLSAMSALAPIIDTDHWRRFYLLLGLDEGSNRPRTPISADTLQRVAHIGYGEPRQPVAAHRPGFWPPDDICVS